MYIVNIYMDKETAAVLARVNGFAWDEGNINKNWELHKVSHVECEELFFNEPLIIEVDTYHSQVEQRYFALGKTDLGRYLFLVFTLRGEKIRVISARDMSKKERKQYV
ncbi:MAG: BrnT family toxin [Actinomycetota bacterium]|nr:BrnT family toxin [Actinomycetota bacterium]